MMIKDSKSTGDTRLGKAGAMALAGMAISLIGIAQLKMDEGLRLTAYKDQADVLTICYGSTHGVHPGQTLTEEQCDQKLRTELDQYIKGVREAVHRPITQGQMDTLVNFAYQFGVKNLSRSTLVSKINAGDCYGAAREFSRWVYVGPAGNKKVNKGVQARMKRHEDTFMEGCVSWPDPAVVS